MKAQKVGQCELHKIAPNLAQNALATKQHSLVEMLFLTSNSNAYKTSKNNDKEYEEKNIYDKRVHDKLRLIFNGKIKIEPG